MCRRTHKAPARSNEASYRRQPCIGQLGGLTPGAPARKHHHVKPASAEQPLADLFGRHERGGCHPPHRRRRSGARCAAVGRAALATARFEASGNVVRARVQNACPDRLVVVVDGDENLAHASGISFVGTAAAKWSSLPLHGRVDQSANPPADSERAQHTSRLPIPPAPSSPPMWYTCTECFPIVSKKHPGL